MSSNIWYYGVVDTEHLCISKSRKLNTTIPCLVSYDEMQNWETNNTANWNILQNIRCENGAKKGLDCYDESEAKSIFGPTPGKQQKAGIAFEDSNGNPIKPDSSGYCKYPDPSFSSKPINIGPPDSSGNCTRNIFYCNGHGTCNKESKTPCDCEDGYNNKGQGANMCVKNMPQCPFDPSAKEYGCASNITLANEDRTKYVNYKLGECDGISCTCYDPDGNPNRKTGSWEKIDGKSGYQQIGIDVTSAIATNNIPKCSVCVPDLGDKSFEDNFYDLSNFPGFDMNRCSNNKTFGCCSGKCRSEKLNGKKGFVCGECMCDSHCSSDKFCLNSVCVPKTTQQKDCWKGGTTYFPGFGGNCCHPGGFSECPDDNDAC